MSRAARADNIPHGTKSRSLRTPLDPIIKSLALRLGGNKAREVERFLKFAIVGISGAIVDFGTSNVLMLTILPPINSSNVAIATTIAFISAVVNNFTWNRFWTYPDSRSRSVRRQLAQFAVVSVTGWLGRTIWISASYLALGKLATNLMQSLEPELTLSVETTNQIGANIALFIGVFVVMIWNFFINRYWTYNDVD